MLYKYKEAFSLRDEIGTCPNIEVEIDIMDKFPFYKVLPHTRGRQSFNQQRDEKIMLSKYIERRFFTLFQPSNVNYQKINQRQESGQISDI